MAARVPEGVRLSRPGPSTAWWVALVGRTILRTQVAQFGASLRDLPPGLSTALETFYRKLILLAFHPRGSQRAMTEHQKVADAAISRREFCRRFGEPARRDG